MSFIRKFILLFLFTSIASSLATNCATAKTRFISPLLSDWIQSFYTDDSSYYLTLYPNGFKQTVRVNKEACGQITSLNIVFKDTVLSTRSLTSFRQISDLNKINLYGVKASNYCWYEVEARGINLSATKSIKYVIQINDNQNSSPYFFKGLTNSLLPIYRITESSTIDSWIDLGNFGATPVVGGGVFFKVWEPLSDEVHLFLNNKPAIKMNAEFALNDEKRFHFIYVPSAKPSDLYHYQFVKNGQYETLEIANFKSMSAIKIDPMARELVYDQKGGLYNGFINPRGVVSQDNDPQEYSWKNDSSFQSMSAQDYNNWIIYQLWPLTFNPQQVNGVFTQGKFKDIIPRIPYITSLGVNSVELLPVNISRFNASWGYALDSLLIIEDSLGTKADFKKLIDELHGNNLRILFDVVINHVNNNLLREPLSATQNSSKFYSGDTPWGPKPRFDSIWVRKWIADSLIHMTREFHLDGFRYDMTDSIFNGTRGGYRFLQELNFLMKAEQPQFYISAEQLPDDVWATYPIYDNGLGFDAQWNDRFKNFFELEFDNYRDNNREVDLTFLSQALMGYSDHEISPNNFYSFGDPLRTVNYLGSHDFVGNKNPFIRIVSGYKAEEQEDDNIFERVNPLEEPGDLKIPFRTIHNSFSHAAARLGYGILFTKPGASLFYQGEELAQDLNLENEWSYMNALLGNRFPSKNVNVDKYVRSNRMPWYYYDLARGERIPQLNFTTDKETQLFSGHLNFFKQMISFKKNNPEINNSEAQNVQINNGAKITTYELKTSQSWYFIVANFGIDSGGTWIQFPGDSSTWWDELMNSSEMQFGGDNNIYSNIISNLGGRQNLLRLKAPGFYIFKAMGTPTVKRALYLRSTLNNWQALSENQMHFNPSNKEELITEFDVISDQSVEFKIASDNWEIDLGQAIKSQLNVKSIDNEISMPITGALSYIPLNPNVKNYLQKGHYQLTFNMRTFNYTINKK